MEKGFALHMNKVESKWKICANFGSIWPSGSEEKVWRIKCVYDNSTKNASNRKLINLTFLSGELKFVEYQVKQRQMVSKTE